jgi:hypothetical protein
MLFSMAYNEVTGWRSEMIFGGGNAESEKISAEVCDFY